MTPYHPSPYAICAAELGIRALSEQQRIVAVRLALRGEGVVEYEVSTECVLCADAKRDRLKSPLPG